VIRTSSFPMQFDRQKWARDVKAARLDAGVTLDDVAAMTGVARTTLGNYETSGDFPLMSNFVLVCNVLDLQPQRYFSLADGTGIR